MVPQIQAEHETLSLVGRRVTVRRLRGGAVQLLSKDQKLAFKELPTRPARAPPERLEWGELGFSNRKRSIRGGRPEAGSLMENIF